MFSHVAAVVATIPPRRPASHRRTRGFTTSIMAWRWVVTAGQAMGSRRRTEAGFMLGLGHDFFFSSSVTGPRETMGTRGRLMASNRPNARFLRRRERLFVMRTEFPKSKSPETVSRGFGGWSYRGHTCCAASFPGTRHFTRHSIELGDAYRVPQRRRTWCLVIEPPMSSHLVELSHHQPTSPTLSFLAQTAPQPPRPSTPPDLMHEPYSLWAVDV